MNEHPRPDIAEHSLPAAVTGPLKVLRTEAGGARRYACRPLVALSDEKNTVFAMFTGQIGLAQVPEFKAALHDLASDNPVKVILDFSDLALTKSAMGALVSFAAFMHGRNKRLYLHRCSAQVSALLEELSLSVFFSYVETEDDIIATLVV